MGEDQDVVPNVDLTDTQYKIKQRVIRNKYSVYDQNGGLVLKTKQKMFKVKEEFPFTDPDGNPVFSIKAQNLLDIAGDYALTAADTGNVFAVLSKKFTLFVQKWEVKDVEGNVQAVIRSKSKILSVLRAVSNVASIIPHSYVIETPDGQPIGGIEGKFSLRDTYVIKIDRPELVTTESLVAAAIAVDALEGN